MTGGLSSFDLTGNIGSKNHVNSRWLLNNKLTLDRAILTSDSKAIPSLPEASGVELNMPAMDGAQWLALFQQGAVNEVSSNMAFPGARDASYTVAGLRRAELE